MVMYLLDWLNIFLISISSKKSSIAGVAFIRLGGGIGDWITLLPSINLIREKFPTDKNIIYAIVDEQWQSLAKINNQIDQVIPVNRKKYGSNIFYRFKINHQIRSLSIDTIFDFALFRRLSIGDSIVRASGARERIGYSPQPDQPREIRFGNAIFTKLIADCKWQEHEIVRGTRLINSDPDDSKLMDLTPRLNHISSKKNNQFVCAPGASVDARMWAPENFAALAQYIYATTGWQPILIGSKTDRVAIAAVLRNSPTLPWMVHDGSLKVLEFIELISASNLLICNDSGPMHIGPAVQTYTAAIVTGAEFTAYPRYPRANEYLNIVHTDTACFNCRWNCKYDWDRQGPAPCLKAVDLSTAIKCINQTLELEHLNATPSLQVR